MPKSGWIEVFKEGEHTAGNGIKKKYTAEDLDSMVSLYNEQKDHDAPFVLGHPKTDDPAYGWVKELKHVGKKLLAFVDSVQDEVVDAISRGEYKKVSIALYPNLLLRHVGLLGATPPAVKGLTSVSFAEDEEFAEYFWATDEWRVPIIGRLFRGVREFLIEKWGQEVADRLLPNWDIDTLTEPALSEKLLVPTPPITPPESIGIAPPGAITSTYAETNKEDEMDETRIKAIEDAVTKQGELIADLTAKFGESQTQIAGQFTELISTLRSDQQTNLEKVKLNATESAKLAFSEYLDGLIRDGKVLPGEKDDLTAEYADLLKLEESFEFAEGETLYSEKMKTRLGNRPVLVTRNTKPFAQKDAAAKTSIEVPTEFAEMANKVDPASVDIHNQILAYAEAQKLTYEEAAAKYMKA